MANRDQEKQEAYDLYMRGWSFRDIAAKVLPGASGGYVSVFRWAKKDNWAAQREEFEQQARDADHRRYVQLAAESQERELRIARKAMLAVELALDSYFEEDGAGNIIGIKMHAKTGNPLISPIVAAQMMGVASELERRVLNLDTLSAQEAEQSAVKAAGETRVVEADPAQLAAIGDFLAKQALGAPAEAPAETTHAG